MCKLSVPIAKRFCLISIMIAFMICFWSIPVQSATLTVTSSNDSGAGTLRAAIDSAAAFGDTIVFSTDCTVMLGTQYAISKDLTIDGSGHKIVLDGHGFTRVFYVNAGYTLTLKNLTMYRGYSGSATSDGGGGILNKGHLTVSGCYFNENYAGWNGGAILSSGTPTSSSSITNCTFYKNSAQYGGAVYLIDGTHTVTNCTIYDNHASHLGGGLHWDAYGSYTIKNSIIAGNTDPNAAGHNCYGYGSGPGGTSNLTDDSSCPGSIFSQVPYVLLGSLPN